MPKVSPKERALAERMDRERTRAERRGVRAGRLLGLQLRSRFLATFLRGGDPIPLFEDLFRKFQPLLRDGLIEGHLAGLNRSVISFEQAPKPKLQLATSAYAESIEALRVRLGFTKKRIRELNQEFGPQAANVLATSKEAAERVLQREMIAIQTEGLHVSLGVKRLRKAFDRAGISPVSDHLLERTFRTQTQIAYSAGRWQADQDPAIQSILWGYKYVTVGDARVRPTHMALDGVTLPKDDPRWDEIYPPNGFNCRCAAISIFEERQVVVPKEVAIIDGQRVIPGADSGFAFNPGKILVP